ncbi:MAG: hypothetical protein NC238_00260 [Dehalobacter sp.]|nr:hypothetical protein [Dehalobacter sp.]
MHIALCVKQVYDATGPFSLTEETKAIDTRRLVPIVNPADLAALALIREVLPAGTAKVTAISVGPKPAERALRSCVASGADEAVRIWDNALDSALTEVGGGEIIARMLAAAIRRLNVDLVVCGSHGLCGASGFVGPALAEYLEFAQISSVSRLEISSGENALTVHRRLERGDREIVYCKLPAVITVDEGSAELPYPSMPNVLAAECLEIPVMNLASLDLTPSAIKPGGVQLLNFVPPRPRTKKSAAADTANLTQAQIMQQLSGAGPAKQKSSFIEGDPKKVASEIVRFLEANGIL